MTVRVALVLALLVVLAGCGTDSAPSPPAGVDGLVIPTPSPDPDDFVAGVDNPWFPLEPGTTWRYDVADPRGNRSLRVTVAAGPTIAGVPTTARVSTEAGRTITDYYAQDTSGNVWWFGRKGSWTAGRDGAEAGLAMAATPRVGDGYREAFAPGAEQDVARVVALDGRVTVPAGTYGVLLVEVRSLLPGGATRDLSYAEGIGLVTATAVSGSFRTVRLVGVSH